VAIPSDMLNFLTRKYDILQQEANTRAVGARADANLASVRAGLLPSQVASDNALKGAQVGLAQTQASIAPQEVASQNAFRRSQIERNLSDIFTQSETLDYIRRGPPDKLKPFLAATGARAWRDFSGSVGGLGAGTGAGLAVGGMLDDYLP